MKIISIVAVSLLSLAAPVVASWSELHRIEGRVLERHGIEYLVLDGQAVPVHGARGERFGPLIVVLEPDPRAAPGPEASYLGYGVYAGRMRGIASNDVALPAFRAIDLFEKPVTGSPVRAAMEVPMRRPGWNLAVSKALRAIVAAIALQISPPPAVRAEGPGVEQAVLFTAALDGVDGKALIVVSAELAPGASVGRPFHHGDELLYIVEGTLVLEVHGRPPVVLEAGERYHVPAGIHHDMRNVGAATGKALVIFVAPEGRPVPLPVP